MYLKCNDFPNAIFEVEAYSPEQHAVWILLRIRLLKSDDYADIKKIVDFSNMQNRYYGARKLFKNHRWFLCEGTPENTIVAHSLDIQEVFSLDDPKVLKVGFMLMLRHDTVYIYSEKKSQYWRASILDDGQSIEVYKTMAEYELYSPSGLTLPNRLEYAKALFNGYKFTLYNNGRLKDIKIKDVFISDEPAKFKFGYLLELEESV